MKRNGLHKIIEQAPMRNYLVECEQCKDSEYIGDLSMTKKMANDRFFGQYMGWKIIKGKAVCPSCHKQGCGMQNEHPEYFDLHWTRRRRWGRK